MNISTKGRYGLRAVVDLAMNYGDRPVVLSTIAEAAGYFRRIFGTADGAAEKGWNYRQRSGSAGRLLFGARPPGKFM